jgi:hypothetical protein
MSAASFMTTSSKQSLREPSISTCMSPLRMISPSKAAANATGMGSSLDLILMLRSSRDFLTSLAVVAHGLERARDLVLAEVDVDHDREAQRDGAGARGDDDVVDGAEGVDERG